MDSMIFNQSAGDPVRTSSPSSGVYRTTVGPAYYESWSNFPNGTKFVSVLNFGNDSLDIARDMAVTSVVYQRELVEYFELGNEPTNYPNSRWGNSTAAYVQQWKSWTAQIDTAVNQTLAAEGAAGQYGSECWWASSATTDDSGLNVRPVGIIPAGVDSSDQVAEYSIHSYPFSTWDPERAALATISNILNHTGLAYYADSEILPSAQAAQDSGSRWLIGEFNSISCSGNPNVSDTFAQALWVIDSELIYAVRNASSCPLHQGATLVFQSRDQVNTAGNNGTSGFSTYYIFYPRDSSRSVARVLPSFAGQLFLAEAFATNGTRIMALEAPAGVDSDRFAAYAFYDRGAVSELAVINIQPYYANSTGDYTVELDILAALQGRSWKETSVKRLTTPYVNSKDAAVVTWAGQSFMNGSVTGQLHVEKMGNDGTYR